MSGSNTSIQRRTRVLLADMALVALAGLCAWGGWAALQPEFGTFLLKGARHPIRAGWAGYAGAAVQL
jgi:hypothetical protein